MEGIQRKEVRGVLNKTSMKIHKQEIGSADFQTVCGQTYHAEHGQLRMVQVKQATEESHAEKCVRCFEDGRGY